MGAVGFQAITNLRASGNPRRFFRAINEFLPFLYSEYAMSINLNSETELYADIRQCIQDRIVSTTELVEKLKKNNKLNKLISLFPQTDNIDDWVNFFGRCIWDSTEENNIFIINECKFIMPKLFLSLVEANGEYFAYKYSYDPADGSCAFECFNVEDAPTDPIDIDNPFIFTQNIQSFFEEQTSADTFEMTEEEFFELDSIKSSDEDQRKAITAGTERNVVVLAGAGSGKTRTLVSRLVYLHIIKKIALDRILLLTFTKNAADNMKKRGEAILNPVYEQFTQGKEKPNVRAKTIDAFTYGLMHECYQEMGFLEEPILKLDGTPQTKAELWNLLDETIRENDMKGIFANYYNDDGKPNDKFKYLISDVEKFAYGMPINYAGIERLLHEFIAKQISIHTVYGFVYINYLVKQAIYNPTSALKEIIASRYDCILLDEFQDINILQNETFKPFYNTSMHFTFVGDDDQSIYGWRGSNNSIIKDLVEDSNVDTYYLLTNYRNNPNIVKAGNVILNLITGRAKKDKPIKPNKVTGAKIRIACYDDKYTNLTNEVERLIQSGYSAEDISILSRNNHDKSRIMQSLNAAKIPVAKERIKIDVNDNYKLMKAIISILNEYNIIAACREIKRICNAFDLTENYVRKVVLGKSKPPEALENISKLVDELCDQNNDTLAKAVYRYSLKAGELFENSINDRHSDPVFESFELFCSNNSAPWPISAKQLKEIFRTFEDNTRKENQSGGELDSGVKISTIHTSKGLEYEVVLITGLSLGKYPNTELIDQNFNIRSAQLQTLQDSKQSYERLKQSVKEESFIAMLQESVSSNFDRNEAKAMKEFREELIICSKKDVVGLTAKGVEAFLDSYKYYILPLEKKYQDDFAKLSKHGMMYKERHEILSEEISLLEQDGDDTKSKRIDFDTVEKKLGFLRKRARKSKDRFERFEESIKAIKSHYKLCLVASSYLAEVKKLNEIEKLRTELAEERERSVNEERRLFYVALTRAKDILYLCYEAGAQESEFVRVIPDDLKEQYAILTKEDEREFIRLKQSLAKEVSKEKTDDNVIDSDTTKLVTNNNFKQYISENLSKFRNNNPIFNNLPAKANDFFEKAMGLLFIGEFTGSDFKTEFAHNMQRMAESLLIFASGTNAQLFKTDDSSLAMQIADDIHKATKKCVTSYVSKRYVSDLLTKESKFGDDLLSLKSAGVFHYVIRSGKYTVPSGVKGSWNRNTLPCDPDKFLVAVTDIANTRNVLIHPSDKKWPDDPIPMILANMEIIIKGCCDSKTNSKLASKKPITNALKASDITVGAKLKHCTYGIGTVISNYEQSFTVNFNDVGNKVFMKYSAEKYFSKL